jgi:alpha-beta hydrolase superfamily lysophospholipase
VRFRATDRRRVRGVLTHAGSGAPAVVLVHQSDGGAEQWDAFVPYLHEAGFSTLAYDGRGGFDERGLVSEAEGAVEFLARRRDVGAIGIVGASIGANTAALALARNRGRRLRAGVALSPADSVLAERMQAGGRYRPRHLFVVADPEEFPAARRFLRGATGARALRTREYGHGVDLLGGAAIAGHDADRASVLRWLTSRFR